MTSVAPRNATAITSEEGYSTVAKTDHLSTAMSRMTAQHPFFACYLYDQMTIEETSAVPTAATDGTTMFINPKYFGGLNLNQQVFLLAHEVMHGIYQHMTRAKFYRTRGFGPDMKPFNNTKANKAMDYIINDTLVKAGTGEMPVGGLYHPSFTHEDIWDEIYPKLPDEEDEEGGGNGFDEHLAPDPNTQERSDAEIRRAITSAKNAAKAVGKMPGILEKIVMELVEPTQNWKEILRTMLTATKGNDSATWARGNRRRLAMPPHIYMPGTTGYNMGGVAIVIDTSGSVSQEEMAQFLGECADILSECNPEWTKVLWTDSSVQHVDEVDSADELLELAKWSGGGTYMPAAFEYIKKEGLEPETCVVMTDGYTDFGKPQPYRIIWGITADNITASHGESIHLDIHTK